MVCMVQYIPAVWVDPSVRHSLRFPTRTPSTQQSSPQQSPLVPHHTLVAASTFQTTNGMQHPFAETSHSDPNANSPLGVWVSPKHLESTLWVHEEGVHEEGVHEDGVHEEGVHEKGVHEDVVVLVVVRFVDFNKLFLGY